MIVKEKSKIDPKKKQWPLIDNQGIIGWLSSHGIQLSIALKRKLKMLSSNLSFMLQVQSMCIFLVYIRSGLRIVKNELFI